MAYRWTEETEAELRRMWADNVHVVKIQRHFRIGQETMDAARKRLLLPTRASSFWTPEKEAEAKRLYMEEGRSAAEVARMIGASSRNVVIGKADRSGWRTEGRQRAAMPTLRPKFKAPAVPRAVRSCPPKPGPQNRPGVVFGAYQHEPDFAKAEIVRAQRAEAGQNKLTRVAAGAGVESPNAVPFLDYVSGCKWPIGERGAVSYCCNPVAGGTGWGKRFCEGHYHLAISPNQPNGLRQRDASRLTRFDRVERDRPAPAREERTLWDDAREAA